MKQLITKILNLGTASLSFGLGTTFGATVATLVSAALYGVLGYEATDISLINECLTASSD